jgi:hypothetical protein
MQHGLMIHHIRQMPRVSPDTHFLDGILAAVMGADAYPRADKIHWVDGQNFRGDSCHSFIRGSHYRKLSSVYNTKPD